MDGGVWMEFGVDGVFVAQVAGEGRTPSNAGSHVHPQFSCLVSPRQPIDTPFFS